MPVISIFLDSKWSFLSSDSKYKKNLSICREEAQEYVEIGALNGLFVLGRSMGFIGKLYTISVPSTNYHSWFLLV